MTDMKRVRFVLEIHEQVSADYKTARRLTSTTNYAEVERRLRERGGVGGGWRVIGAHLEEGDPVATSARRPSVASKSDLPPMCRCGHDAEWHDWGAGAEDVNGDCQYPGCPCGGFQDAADADEHPDTGYESHTPGAATLRPPRVEAVGDGGLPQSKSACEPSGECKFWASDLASARVEAREAFASQLRERLAPLPRFMTVSQPVDGFRELGPGPMIYECVRVVDVHAEITALLSEEGESPAEVKR